MSGTLDGLVASYLPCIHWIFPFSSIVPSLIIAMLMTALVDCFFFALLLSKTYSRCMLPELEQFVLTIALIESLSFALFLLKVSLYACS